MKKPLLRSSDKKPIIAKNNQKIKKNPMAKIQQKNQKKIIKINEKDKKIKINRMKLL